MTTTERDLTREKQLLDLKVPSALCFYAIEVLQDRWPEAEPYIKDSDWAYEYAKEIIKGRWPEAEPNILKNYRNAYLYARYIIKGRWPEAEKVFIENKGNYDYEGNPVAEIFENYLSFLRLIGKDLDIWKSEEEFWE